MTKQEIKKFVDAMDAAGIKTYCFVDGFETLFWNNENSSKLIIDEANELLIEVRSVLGGRKAFSDNSSFTIAYVPFETLAEARVGMQDISEMKNVLSNLGYVLDDEDFRRIAKFGYKQSFVTQDYTFKKLTQEQYDKLSENEKAEYDKKLKDYENKQNGVSQGGVSVDTGAGYNYRKK